MIGENLPFTYFVSIGFFLSFTIFYITAFCWRRKRSVSTFLYQDEHVASYEGIHYVYYVARVTTSCLPYSGCRRLRNLRVNLQGSKRNCRGNVFSPSRNLFMRGSTDLLVMSSMQDIGDVVGVDFELAFSGINKSSVWTLTAVEVFCCKTHERYHMEKCLKFNLPVGVDQNTIHVDLIPGELKPSIRCFPQLVNQILDYHLWMFGKYHYGEFKPHDNIMLLFAVMSLSMVGNFFVLYWNNNTSDFDRPFSLTLPLLLWSQVFNVAIFLLSCCCEAFLRNVRMKKKGKKDEFIFSPEPGQEYVYFGKLLHRIYSNLGLHHCKDAMSPNAYTVLDLRDRRPMSRKDSKSQLFIPEVLRPYNISHLIADWETKLIEVYDCRLCKLNNYIDVFRNDESFSLLYSLAPFIKLEGMAIAVVKGDDFCVRFDSATDHYTESSDKYSEKNNHSLKIARKFVDSLMCILQLFKITYIDDLGLTEIWTLFNLYKSFAYDILHYHAHELLTSNEMESKASLSSKEFCSQSQYPGDKIKTSIANNMNSLSMDLDTQNRMIRKVSFSRADPNVLVLPEVPERKISLKRTSSRFQNAHNQSVISGTSQANLRIFDNKRWRMLHWRSDLDDVINILLDSVVLIPPKQYILNHKEMGLKEERMETIFLYAENLLLNCTWHSDICDSCIDSAIFERSPWKIPRLTTIEEHVIIQDLSRNFEAFYLSREILIEKAINRVEDLIFYGLINLVMKESQRSQPVPYLEVTALELTNQAIVEAIEELDVEKDYPVFALSRLALFVSVAKFLNMNRDYISRCPTLVGFLEVSQTDLDQCENMMLSLVEIIFYEMSQSIFKILSPKKTKWPQRLFERYLVEGLCQRVLVETRDQITELTLDFLADIIDNRKNLRKQNLTSMFVSANLDIVSEQQHRLIKDSLDEFLELKEFSELGNEQAYLRRKNLFHEKSTQTRHKKVEVKIDIGSGTDVGKDAVNPKSFLEVREQELGLPRSYLSILFMLTYRVWFQDKHSKKSDGFLWQFYSAYFEECKKPFPHWTKTIIQLFIMSLIMSGFIYLPFNEKRLKGTAIKEWCVLFLLSLGINALIFEFLKVAAIWIYQYCFQKEEEEIKES